jgi:DNA-binding beta-propeller fold protein YncE
MLQKSSFFLKYSLLSTLIGMSCLGLFGLEGCGSDERGVTPPQNELYYPLGIAPHPDGRYLYISNSIFDRQYNASTLTVFDTFTHQFLEKATVELGLFSGELKLIKRACSSTQNEDAENEDAENEDAENEDAECGSVVGYITTRDYNELITLNFQADQGNQKSHIQCDQGIENQGYTDRSPYPIKANRCGGEAVIFNAGDQNMGEAPYSISADSQGLWVSHLDSNSISRWRLPSLDFDPQSRPVFDCQLTLGGANLIAIHPVSKLAFVSDRFGQSIQVIAPNPKKGGACQLNVQQRIALGTNQNDGETRGLTFSADGTLMYVTNATEGALQIYDTSLNRSGQSRNQLLKSLPVGQQANMVRVAGLRSNEFRPASNTKGISEVEQSVDQKGQGLVYVTVYGTHRILVIDPQRFAVIREIKVDKGPHDIVFMPNEEGELRGYVTHFQDHSLSIIDLEPNSPTRFTVLKTINPSLDSTQP